MMDDGKNETETAAVPMDIDEASSQDGDSVKKACRDFTERFVAQPDQDELRLQPYAHSISDIAYKSILDIQNDIDEYPSLVEKVISFKKDFKKLLRSKYHQFNSIKLNAKAIEALLIKVFPEHKTETDTNTDSRIVTVDYHITDTKLSHPFDLNQFSTQVQNVQESYWGVNGTKGPSYDAPYFCVIQSSGMGKTKLLHEYRKACLSWDDNKKEYMIQNFEAKIILVGPLLTKEEEKVFDANFDFQSAPARKSDQIENVRRGEALNFYKNLDKLVDSLNWKKTDKEVVRVLLFDEAQYLLEIEHEMKALKFRCARVWLRERKKTKVCGGVYWDFIWPCGL